MNLFDKIKWILGIMLVFFIVLATNLIDRHNFSRIRDSAVTIYEDRLIANDLLFKMASIVHDKEVAVVTKNALFFDASNKKYNLDFDDLIRQYELTKLTTSESRHFEQLKRNYEQLRNVESTVLSGKFTNAEEINGVISKLKTNLSDLSKIQKEQGHRQMMISKQAMDSIDLFTQIEIYILILLAVLVQILVIYKPK